MDGAQKKASTELEICQATIAELKAIINLLEQEIEQAKVYENNYINTEEAAILLDVKPRTIRKYNQEGKLTGRKRKKEGRLLFPLKEVLKFRKENLRHWATFN